jgi:hypothetical protein
MNHIEDDVLNAYNQGYKDASEKLGKQMQWVSDNTPPEIDDVYLVRYSSGYKTTQAYSGVGSFCGGITHWMPLPPDPKEAE